MARTTQPILTWQQFQQYSLFFQMNIWKTISTPHSQLLNQYNVDDLSTEAVILVCCLITNVWKVCEDATYKTNIRWKIVNKANCKLKKYKKIVKNHLPYLHTIHISSLSMRISGTDCFQTSPLSTSTFCHRLSIEEWWHAMFDVVLCDHFFKFLPRMNIILKCNDHISYSQSQHQICSHTQRKVFCTVSIPRELVSMFYHNTSIPGTMFCCFPL